MSRSPAELPAGSWPPLHDLARWIGTWLFRPAFRVRHHGLDRIPPDGAVVLVANHGAFVDGPLLFGVCRRRVVFLVKQEMFGGPVGWALHRIGQLPVRRDRPDRAPLIAAQGVLRAGGMVAVFPEGTRGTGDATSARNGAAWLARTCEARVVPVVVRGTHRPRGVSRRYRPRVDVLVGRPFRVGDDRGRAGLAAATEQLRVALTELITELDGWREDVPAGRTEGER